jgi:hypothetical protein
VDKNFNFHITNKDFIIGKIALNNKTKQADIDLIGYEYYNDYQDKFIYTLKERLIFKNINFKVTVVFKSYKIWLIEIKHENDDITDDTLIKELHQYILSTNLSGRTKAELMQKKLLRLEFINN